MNVFSISLSINLNDSCKYSYEFFASSLIPQVVDMFLYISSYLGSSTEVHFSFAVITYDTHVRTAKLKCTSVLEDRFRVKQTT